MSTPVGVWVRVSTGLQDEVSQVPDIERYCDTRGYSIVKRYQLNDRSAYKGEQEARQQEALDDVRSGAVMVVVVWASDRIERRGAEATLRIFRQFREAGGRLESVLEPQLNTADPDLMLAITGWKDQQESKRKSERIRIGFDRIKTNNALYGRPPYGFTSEGDKYHRRIVHKPGEAEILTEAAQRYLGGESLQEIASDLNRRGVPSPNWHGKPGAHWYPRTIGVLLRNPAMIGRRMDRNGQTATRFEPLISVKDFEQIDRLMTSRGAPQGCPLPRRNGDAYYRHSLR